MVARRDTPAVRARDVRERPPRVAESDRREPRLGLLARELEAARGQRRHRRQQRSVEEALVQAAHALPGRLPEGGEVVGVAARPDERASARSSVRVARHEVGAAQPLELEPVLEHAEHPVVARELGRLLAADVAVLGEGRERGQRARLADRVVGRPVHELEQLHGELDVAQAAGPELQLHVDLVGRDVLGDPLAHALDRLDEAVAARTRPHLRRHARGVALARARGRLRAGAPSAAPGTPSSSPSGRSTAGATRACARVRRPCPRGGGSGRPPRAAARCRAPRSPAS